MNTEDKYVSPVPNSNEKENPSLSPEIVSHVVPTTTPEKKEEHVLTPDQVDVTQESSTTSSSTGEVSVQETVTTANVDPTPSGNIEATPKRTLPHSYPVTMVKLTKDGKVKKSPKPIQVHSHQEFIGKLDEGWVLKPVEQLTMFNDNIDARELHFFNELKEIYSLEDADHDVVKETNSLLALLQIREFTDEQKMGFALYMSKMIVVDGDINANEVAIYNVVSEFCSINKGFDENIPSEELNAYTHS